MKGERGFATPCDSIRPLLFRIRDKVLTCKIKKLENDISYTIDSIRILATAKDSLMQLLQELYNERQALHDEYYNQKGESDGS